MRSAEPSDEQLSLAMSVRLGSAAAAGSASEMCLLLLPLRSSTVASTPPAEARRARVSGMLAAVLLWF
jgi:hypothetical protein